MIDRMHLGIVGTESSHVTHIIRHLNAERRFGDWRVSALWGANEHRTRDLAHTAAADVVAQPEDLLGHVDAVMVADRDGAHHRKHAMPFLEAGLPVLVDKPFATTVDDAVAMVDAATAHDAPLLSASALRWATEVLELAHLDGVDTVVAKGPADPASPYSGWHYYGVHPAEMALSLVAGELGEVAVKREPDRLVLSTTVGAVRVVVNLVDGSVPFNLLAITADGIRIRDVPLADDYLAPVLERFFTMVRTGQRPLTYAEMIRSVQLLAAADHV